MIALFAQNFVADEFIVEYVAGTTSTEREAVRDLFGITNTTDISEEIELWADITFPLLVTENGETTIVDDVEELLYYINIQEGDDDGNEGDASAIINNGNLNLLLQLEQDGVFNDNGTFDPLPYCDDIHNNRLIGEDQSNNPHQSDLKIVIIDQQTGGTTNMPFEGSPSNTGGAHGNKVLSVIQNILTQAGVTEIEYYNLVAFDDEGTSTTSALISAIEAIIEQYQNGSWDENDKIIVNFSANIVIPNDLNAKDYFGLIENVWGNLFGSINGGPGYFGDNILLVSSAGNQGSNSNNVFPGIGTSGLFAEITVAGTQDCFSKPWEDTNANPIHFEIAAEADNLLTHDGSNYYLSSGTSFSSALVTAALAQLSLENSNSSMDEVRQSLLSSSDIIPALVGTVQYGRVLNLSNAYSHEYVVKPIRASQTTSPLTLTTTPNPFSTTALVTIELPEAGDVTINMYNMMGQRVHEEFISNQQELLEMEWPTPAKLARGTYLLRVQVGEAVEQMMMVKQ
ncbi:MAG: S8 family serine peptidase [Lewinella sp.]|uniref:S8 family serine peptidase n=1 Tax=Lewinella sp. TaxID=2004506 RepID=UPI003D6BDAA8